MGELQAAADGHVRGAASPDSTSALLLPGRLCRRKLRGRRSRRTLRLNGKQRTPALPRRPRCAQPNPFMQFRPGPLRHPLAICTFSPRDGLRRSKSLRDCRKWQPLGSGCARTAYADSPRILSGMSLTDCLRCSDCAAGSGQNGTAAAVRQSDGHGEYDERASRNGAGWLGKRRRERGLVGLSCEQALNILGTTQHRISALRHRFRRGRGCRCSTQRRRLSRSSRTARCTRCLCMRAFRQPPGNVDPFLD